MKLSLLLERYLATNNHLSESTIDQIRLAWRYLTDAFGVECEAGRIGPDQAQFWYGLMLKRIVKNRKISPASVATYKNTIRTVWKWGMDTGKFEASKNPWSSVKLVHYEQEVKPSYTDAELASVIMACPDKRWVLVVCLGMSGLRRAAIFNLTMNDVDFQNSLIYVRPKHQTESTWEWKVKTRNQRTIPMTPEVKAALEDVVLDEFIQGRTVVYPCIPWHRYQTLRAKIPHLNEKIRKCPVNNVWRDFKTILETAGVECNSLHGLRRTAATRMNRNGLTLPTVMKVLGHKVPETTLKHYMSVGSDVLDSARDALAFRQSG